MKTITARKSAFEIDIETLERAVALARELERLSDKLTPFLELVASAQDFSPCDRFVGRGEVRKILRVGNSTIAMLISMGLLTPLYVAGSNEAKFRLSEVLGIPKERGTD